MRRLAFLTAFSMMALFVFAPAAFAQEAAEIVEELVEDELGLRGCEVECGGGLPPGDQSGSVVQDP